MQLPGGFIVDGQRRRDFRLANACGSLDLEIQAALVQAQTHPQWLSQALLLSLAQLGGEEPSLQRVRELCVADRHAIVLHWRIQQKDEPQWFTAQCQVCGDRYDFSLRWAQLPVADAGEGYPLVQVHTTQGVLTLRIPNGGDQEALAQLPVEVDKRLWLAQRLVQGAAPDLSAFDLEAIDSALEEVAPQVAQTVQSECPECGAQQQVELDICAGLARPVDALLDEIHQLAVSYHWSEADILALPDHRRRLYLNRIEHSRGAAGYTP